MKNKEKKDNLLSFLDKKKIINKKRKNQFKSNSYYVDKEKEELDTKIFVDKVENECERLDAENFILDKKIDNAKEKNKLANYQTAIDLNEKIAENKKMSIKRILKQGKKKAKKSVFSCLVSAITTCIALCLTNTIVPVKIFLCIATCAAAVLVNSQISGLPCYVENFFEKDKKNYSITYSNIILILAYTAYSIKTNIMFWKNFFEGIELIIFSGIFDLISIILAYESYMYLNLAFNQKTKNNINKVFDEEKNNNEEKENETPDELNAGNF